MARPRTPTPTPTPARPIAITGIGVVSPLGLSGSGGAAAFWEGLCQGRVAIGRPATLDASSFSCQFAAEAPALDMKEHLPKHYRKFARVMARDIQLAVVAANEAASAAGLGSVEDGGRPYPPHRLGTHVGAGLMAPEIPELARAMHAAADEDGNWDMGKWGEVGMGQLTPLWMLKYLPNMLACHVSILHQAKGPSNTITAGEASGLLSIGEAMRVIERGDADASLAGSGDSRVNHLAIERLRLAGRLAETAGIDDPGAIVRPFDPAAIGSVPGEGAAVFFLERPEAARARGARATAMLLGFGAAQAVPELREGGPVMAGLGAKAGGSSAGLATGIAQAISRALADAGVGPGDIDAVFCHAAGEAALDEGEALGLQDALGAHAAGVELFWLGPAIGETMAAGGSLLVAAAAMALRDQQLPARLQPGQGRGDLRTGPRPSAPATLRRVLVCSHALGGQCAALVLGPADAEG